MPTWLIVLLALLGPVVFGAFWMAMTRVIATAAGWPRLAAEFRAPPDFPREEPFFAMSSGRIGLARFNGVLRVGVGPSGLYLGLMPLFGWGSPPVLIPWDRVEELGTGWGWRRLRIHCRKPVSLSLSGRVWEARRGGPGAAGDSARSEPSFPGGDLPSTRGN